MKLLYVFVIFQVLFSFTALGSVNSCVEMLSKQNTDTFSELRRVSDVFHELGYHVPDRAILEAILRTQESKSTPLSSTQIIAIAKFLLPPGKMLSKRRSCFTCNMRVLTPTGYVKISDLQVGMKVVSYDFSTGEKAESEIQAVNVSKEIEYGVLSSDAYLEGVLEITPDHPIYDSDRHYFLSVDAMSDNSTVLLDDNSSGRGTSRGAYTPVGMATVYSLTLKGPFKNYFVEGILVRNRPMHIT